jgi:hypothetical protein
MANDHYIPRFYLKNFEIPNRRGCVFVYRRGRQPEVRGVKSVGSANDFYTLKAEKVNIDRNAPDDFLKRIESDAAPIINRVLATPKLKLSNEELGVLAFFFGYLAVRTPVMRKRAINAKKATKLAILKAVAEDKKGYIRFALEHDLAKTEEEAEGYRQATLLPEENFVTSLVGDVEDFSLQQAFSSGELITQAFLRKHWILIEASSTAFFMTSDNPVVVLAPVNLRPGMDINYFNSSVLIPISPKRAFFLSNNVATDGVWVPSPIDMDRLVRQIILFGYESVFADRLSPKIKKLFESVPFGEITKVPLPELPPKAKQQLHALFRNPV